MGTDLVLLKMNYVHLQTYVMVILCRLTPSNFSIGNSNCTGIIYSYVRILN